MTLNHTRKKFWENNFTATNLLALTVIFMISGHAIYFFPPEQLWFRLPDRILVPVFLVLVGYNTGYPLGKVIWVGAIVLTLFHYIIFDHVWLNILGTIILVRYTLPLMMKVLAKRPVMFWGVNILFFILAPFANLLIEYGTVAYIMAMAGWINRNRNEVKGTADPLFYFVFATAAYLFFTQVVMGFTDMQFLSIACGVSIVMYLLYNFRDLLMNSIKKRPKDWIERFIDILGRKSLEIYIVHVVLFQFIYYIAIFKPFN